MNGRGTVGMGAGGIGVTPFFSVRQARYLQQVTNIGDALATVVIDTNIP
jgi:hypothetical protein